MDAYTYKLPMLHLRSDPYWDRIIFDSTKNLHVTMTVHQGNILVVLTKIYFKNHVPNSSPRFLLTLTD